MAFGVLVWREESRERSIIVGGIVDHSTAFGQAIAAFQWKWNFNGNGNRLLDFCSLVKKGVAEGTRKQCSDHPPN